MKNALKILVLLGTMASPAALFAQSDGQAPAEDAGQAATPEKKAVPAKDLPGELSMGQADGAGAPGETYVQEVVDDWTVQCVRAPEGEDPCQLYQLLRDADGNAVAEVSIFPLPEGGQAVAGATIITPLETLLTQQISLKIDKAAAKRYPFSWCSQVGCFARIGFTQADVNAFRAGAAATLTIVPVAAPDKKVDLTMSLKGFTKGYEALAH